MLVRMWNKIHSWTTNFVTLSLILASLALTSSRLVFADDNGSGYGGPTLQTVSAPAQADKVIRLSEVKKVITVCLATGDESRGIKSLAQRLYSLIFGKVNVPVDFYRTFDSDFLGGFDPSQSFIDARVDVETTDIHNRISMSVDHGFSGKWALLPTLTLSVERPDKPSINLESGRYTSIGSIGEVYYMPMITWNGLAAEPQYDELGALQVDDLLLKGVKVSGPRDQIMKFFTRQNRSTALQINTSEYYDCLNGMISSAPDARKQ